MARPDEERPELVALIDLHPTDAATVQDAMANVGLEAVPYRLGVESEESSVGRLVIRLYVPRAQLRDARSVVWGVLPEYRPTGAQGIDAPAAADSADADRAFAEIVAGLRSDGFSEPTAPPRPPPPDPEEHFHPPVPPPIPRPAFATVMAWLAMVVGLVLAGYSLPRGGGTLGVLLGIALFLGGFVAVIARARRHRDHDDDGAVV